MASIVYFALGALVLCYAGLFVFAVVVGPKMIFPAPPSTYEKTLVNGWLETRLADQMAYTFFENTEADYHLLYSHGNGEDLGMIHELMEKYRDHGFSVMAYDYPGYGHSSGRASEEGCFAAIERAYEFLVKEKGVSPDKVILYGRSLGGGPTTYLASRVKIGGVILEGTFTSTYRVITKRKILPMDVFDSISYVKKITAPSLVIHGTIDATVPFAHGQELFANLPEPKTFYRVEGAGHNDVISKDVETYKRYLTAFRDGLRSGEILSGAQ